MVNEIIILSKKQMKLSVIAIIVAIMTGHLDRKEPMENMKPTPIPVN